MLFPVSEKTGSFLFLPLTPMRIWSLHPGYLDVKGLTALWRESLLAKHVLEGKTRGYIHHPQLNRFRAAANPMERINQYLSVVWREAEKRGYDFNRGKIDWNFSPGKMKVTRGQLAYESLHLKLKLKKRDSAAYKKINSQEEIKPHPMFRLIDGDIEEWEIIPIVQS